MGRADRNINRFVLMYGLDEFVDGHARRAAHHDPVLGTMMVLLQREPAARLDHNTLDLMALADINRLIGSPRPMCLEMILGELRGYGLEFGDQPLQSVGL